MASSNASIQPTAERHANAPRGRWRAAAFGLSVAGRDTVMGLSSGAAHVAPGAPSVAFELVDRAAIDRVWPRDGVRRIGAQLHPDGRATMAIDEHPKAGYRMTGAGYGRALLTPQATRVRLAPVRGSRWRWQRYLIAQVLPFAAGLNGIELMHAGAVVLDGAALAIVGGSGRGKSVLVATLVNRGASFMTDDVLALASEGNRVIGHPGPGVLVLSERGRALLTRPPGPLFRGAQGEGAFALEPSPPAPLRVVCFLDGEARRPVVERVAADPRLLLGSAYEAVRRGPGRLRAQLELLSELAASTRLLRVRRPVDASPDAVARALLYELGIER